jgi:hypothetical protein
MASMIMPSEFMGWAIIETKRKMSIMEHHRVKAFQISMPQEMLTKFK